MSGIPLEDQQYVCTPQGPFPVSAADLDAAEYEGLVFISAALAAIEEARAEGIKAARDAVAAQQLHPEDQDDKWSSLTHVVVIQTALAAIDAINPKGGSDD
jgi:hypothetical protein